MFRARRAAPTSFPVSTLNPWSIIGYHAGINMPQISDCQPGSPYTLRYSIRLVRYGYQSNSLSTMLDSSSVRTRLGFQLIQSCNNSLHSNGTKRMPNVPMLFCRRLTKPSTYLGLHSAAQRHPCFVSQTGFCLSKYQCHHPHIRIGRFPQSSQ